MNFQFQRIESVHSSKAIAVGDGGLIRQYPWSPQDLNQHWLQHMGAGETRVFQCRATGEVIDAIGGTAANNVILQHYPRHNNPNQRWRLESVPNTNHLYMYMVGTTFVWDLPSGSADDGMVVQLYQFHGGMNQRWRAHPAPVASDAFIIQSALSDHVIDVPGFASGDGQQLQQYAINRGFNQFWERIPVGATNLVQFRSVSSGKLLTYPSAAANQNAAAPLVQQADNSSNNQRWTLEPAAGSTVRIISAVNNFCVTVPNNSNLSGMMLRVENATSGANQRWRLRDS
jgi:hypothetical protein